MGVLSEERKSPPPRRLVFCEAQLHAEEIQVGLPALVQHCMENGWQPEIELGHGWAKQGALIPEVIRAFLELSNTRFLRALIIGIDTRDALAGELCSAALCASIALGTLPRLEHVSFDLGPSTVDLSDIQALDALPSLKSISFDLPASLRGKSSFCAASTLTAILRADWAWARTDRRIVLTAAFSALCAVFEGSQTPSATCIKELVALAKREPAMLSDRLCSVEEDERTAVEDMASWAQMEALAVFASLCGPRAGPDGHRPGWVTASKLKVSQLEALSKRDCCSQGFVDLLHRLAADNRTVSALQDLALSALVALHWADNFFHSQGKIEWGAVDAIFLDLVASGGHPMRQALALDYFRWSRTLGDASDAALSLGYARAALPLIRPCIPAWPPAADGASGRPAIPQLSSCAAGDVKGLCCLLHIVLLRGLVKWSKTKVISPPRSQFNAAGFLRLLSLPGVLGALEDPNHSTGLYSALVDVLEAGGDGAKDLIRLIACDRDVWATLGWFDTTKLEAVPLWKLIFKSVIKLATSSPAADGMALLSEQWLDSALRGGTWRIQLGPAAPTRTAKYILERRKLEESRLQRLDIMYPIVDLLRQHRAAAQPPKGGAGGDAGAQPGPPRPVLVGSRILACLARDTVATLRCDMWAEAPEKVRPLLAAAFTGVTEVLAEPAELRRWSILEFIPNLSAVISDSRIDIEVRKGIALLLSLCASMPVSQHFPSGLQALLTEQKKDAIGSCRPFPFCLSLLHPYRAAKLATELLADATAFPALRDSGCVDCLQARLRPLRELQTPDEGHELHLILSALNTVASRDGGCEYLIRGASFPLPETSFFDILRGVLDPGFPGHPAAAPASSSGDAPAAAPRPFDIWASMDGDKSSVRGYMLIQAASGVLLRLVRNTGTLTDIANALSSERSLPHRAAAAAAAAVPGGPKANVPLATGTALIDRLLQACRAALPTAPRADSASASINANLVQILICLSEEATGRGLELLAAVFGPSQTQGDQVMSDFGRAALVNKQLNEFRAGFIRESLRHGTSRPSRL